MRWPAAIRARVSRRSLGRRLILSFAGVALFTMVVLGAILLPLLGNYYARSEVSYLEAGADEVARLLSGIDWTTVAAEGGQTGSPGSGLAQTPGSKTAEAVRQAQAVALSTQLRIEVYAPDGSLLVDTGSPQGIDPTGLAIRDEAGAERDGEGDSRPKDREHDGELPGLLGGGLLSGDQTSGAPRSDRSVETQLTSGGAALATIRVSEAPAYGSAALRSVLVGWLLAGVAAVILAAVVGWVSSRYLTRPLHAITTASDKMARGDLTVRADVRRSDEIGSLAGSFNAMAAQMQHTVTALQRFVADAAHELGTPLTALETDLELAQAQTNPADQQQLIARAMQQAERLERLSGNLLRLSRLEAGGLRESLQVVDVVPLIRDMADAMASRAEQSGLEFSLELPSDPVPARIHADKLRTAIDNLVDNALKFTPRGGRVVIGAAATAGGALIWVEDTGIGIPPEDMDGLFGRFHRGRNAAAYPGSGLGLAIVQATVELHGGHVRAESRPGRTRFELTLPAV